MKQGRKQKTAPAVQTSRSLALWFRNELAKLSVQSEDPKLSGPRAEQGLLIQGHSQNHLSAPISPLS